MDLQWDDAHYFLVLSKTGSLSAASRALKVRHTTVARRLAAFETALGVRLFDRLPRGWVLTREGRELVAPAQRLEAEALAFQIAAAGKAALGGTVRVSAAPVVVSHFLLSGLASFHQRHPEIVLEFGSDRRDVNLVRAEADLALRIGESSPQAELIARPLGQVGYGFYGTPAQVGRAAARRTFVGFDASMDGSAQKAWLDQFVGKGRVGLRSNDLAALHRAATLGWGIALLPHLMVGPSDGLKELALGGVPMTRPFTLLIHPDVRRARRVKLVVEEIVELAQTRSVVLRGPRGRVD